jgi:hypothetical protein
LGEVGEVGAGELEPGFGVFGMLADVVIEFGAGLGSFAGTEETGGLCEWIGGVREGGQGNDEEGKKTARHESNLADMVAYAP